MNCKKLLSPLLLLTFLGCRHTEYQFIPWDEFEHYYMSRKIKSILIDIRSSQEYEKKHLEYSLNLPLDSKDLFDRLDSIARENRKDYWVLFIYSTEKNDIEELKIRVQKHIKKNKLYKKLGAVFYTYKT